MSKELQDALKALIPAQSEPSFWGKVKTVEWSKGMADVTLKADGLDVFDVLLGLDNNKIKPKVGSRCLITRAENKEQYFLSWAAEIEEQWLNGDSYGGLAMTKEIAERFKRLEDAFTALQTKFNAHTHPYVNVVTPAATTPTTTPSSEVLAPTTTQDYISSKVVKHGG